MQRRFALALLVASLACRATPGPERSGGPEGSGRPRIAADAHPLAPAPGRLNVLVFVTTDCPIANGYAPEIQAIAAEHRDDPVGFFLVHVDPEITAERALAHAREFGYALPLVLDPEQALVARTGVTVTPEAVVVDAAGELLYRGRVDDLYENLGRKRRFPRRRDLRAALDAALAGRPIETPRTAAVGCLVPDVL